MGVGESSSIVVASDGTVHIAYADQTNARLKYVKGKTGAFGTPVTLDPVGASGVLPVIALDTSGNAHLLHHDVDAKHARYLRVAPNGTVSHIVELEPTLEANPYAAMVVDAEGDAHVVYQVYPDVGRGVLKYVVISH
jgi:hypothetical protein